MKNIIIVQTTYPKKNTAEELANKLLTEKLAACIQIKEVTSMYQWQGKIQKDEEFLLLIKTYDDLFTTVESAILDHHPYEVPEILALKTSNVTDLYENWMSNILKA